MKKLDPFDPEVLQRAQQIKAEMPRGWMRDGEYVAQAMRELEEEQKAEETT